MAQCPRKIIGFAQYFYVLSGLMGILFDVHVSDTKFISVLNRQEHLWSIVLLTLPPNSLYRTERFANFEGVFGFFCTVNNLREPLRKKMFTWASLKGLGLWFVVGGFRCVFFIYCVAMFVACDRPVSGYNRQVCIEDFSFLSYSCHLQAE